MTQYGLSPLHSAMGDLEFLKCFERLLVGAFGVPQEMFELPATPPSEAIQKADELLRNTGYYTWARVIAFPSLGQPAWDNEQDHEALVKSMRALRTLATLDPDNAPYMRWKADLIGAALIG